MVIVFVGPPGVGKGTQCRLLADRFGLLHISTGERLREAIIAGTELGRQAADYIDHGRLVPDETMIDLIEECLASSPAAGCLLDGFPRTIVQAEALDQFMAGKGKSIAMAIELKADREEMLRRLRGRADVERRSDDTPATIERRLEIFDRRTLPIVEYYQRQEKLFQIDGLGAPEEVHSRVVECIQRQIKSHS